MLFGDPRKPVGQRGNSGYDERSGNGTSKLALAEQRIDMPFSAVWDQACLCASAPVGASWLNDVAQYEAKVLSQRT